jgi:hypothetical protein
LSSIGIEVNRHTSGLGAAISNSALRIWLFLLRQDVKLARLNVTRLRRRNLMAEASVVAPGGPVVSLTTFGARIQSVYLTLESIAAGVRLPSRLIVWIDDPEAFHNRPLSIRRLEARGLEVHLTRNYGPHTKYFPYLLSTETFSLPLVTADDDVLYPASWLAKLWSAYCENPRVVICHRAHLIPIIDGAFAPYVRWRGCQSTKPSVRHFATGVSGCIYPPEFLHLLKLAGSGFLECCPKADDIWINVNALRAGFKVMQVGPRSLNFPFLPGTQDHGLSPVNVGDGENDRQIARTLTPSDIERILSDSIPSHLTVSGRVSLSL